MGMWAFHPREQTGVPHQSLPKEERKTKMKDEAEGQGVLSRRGGRGRAHRREW